MQHKTVRIKHVMNVDLEGIQGITVDKIESALKQIGNDKTPGDDSIHIEMLKILR